MYLHYWCADSPHTPSCLWLVYSLTTYHITTLLHLMLFPLLLLCPVYCSCMSTSCQCYYSSAITISATTYHWHNHYKYLYILYEFYHFSFILQLAVPLLTMSAVLPITDLTVSEFGDVNIWIGQGRRYQNVPEYVAKELCRRTSALPTETSLLPSPQLLVLHLLRAIGLAWLLTAKLRPSVGVIWLDEQHLLALRVVLRLGLVFFLLKSSSPLCKCCTVLTRLMDTCMVSWQSTP